jgi:hypothetical protein
MHCGPPILRSVRLAKVLEIREMKYYDLKNNWRQVSCHLGDKKLNNILVRDFNNFTFGRWGEKFTHGCLPWDFESCTWRIDKRQRGRPPAFWRYTKHAACHWLVNFNLRLAMLVMPDKPWRIITSAQHSTVWDGGDLIFEFSFQAFGVDPNECFRIASEKELLPGKYLRVYLAEHYTVEQNRERGEASGELLISNDLGKVSAGIKILTQKPELSDSIRHADAAISSVLARGSSPAVTADWKH